MSLQQEAKEYCTLIGLNIGDEEFGATFQARLRELEEQLRLKQEEERKEREEERKEREEERKAREEERKAREHERRMEERRLELEMQQQGASRDLSAHKIRVPPPAAFNPAQERMDEFLDRFKSHTTAIGFSETEKVILLRDCLTPQERRLIETLPSGDRFNFKEIESLLLDAHKITPAKLREKFFDLLPEEGDNMSRFLKRLEQSFTAWLKGCNVGDSREELFDFILTDRAYSSLPSHLATLMRDRGAGSARDLGKEGDLFLQARPHTTLHQLCKVTKSATVKNSSSHSAAPQKSSGQPFASTRSSGTSIPPPSNSSRSSVYSNSRRSTPQRTFHCSYHGDNVSHGSDQCRVLQNRQDNASGAAASRGSAPPLAPSRIIAHNNSINPLHSEEIPEIPPTTCNHLATEDRLLTCKLKTCKGDLSGKSVEILLDSGASAIFVKKELVPQEALLWREITVRTADNSTRRAPLARLNLSCPYYRGEVTVVVMDSLTHDVILGRVPGTSSFEDDPLSPSSNKDQSEAELSPMITRSASRKDKESKERDTSEPISSLCSNEDFKKMQQDCDTLRSIFVKAEQKKEDSRQDGRIISFVLERDILHRKVIQDGQVSLQLVVPKSVRNKILEMAHDNPLSGHFSQNKTQARIEKDFYWPSMYKDVVQYCHSCHICQTRAPFRPAKAPISGTPIATSPFSALSIDLVGPLQPASARGHRYVLTVVDQATRYADAAPLRHIDSDTVAQALMEICSHVGFPRTLTSDNGTQFTSETFEKFLQLMGVSHRLSPPYHAQSNGLVERFNGTLKLMLRKLAAEQPRDWDLYLPPLLFAYRDAPQSATGYSPFELIFGHRVRGPLTLLKEYWSAAEPEDSDTTSHQYLAEMKHRLKETCKLARDALQSSQEAAAKYFNKRTKMRTLREGDRVMIFLPHSTKKLLMTWKGPYSVKSRLGTYTYAIDVNGTNKTYHINLLRKYHGREDSTETDPDHTAVTPVNREDSSGPHQEEACDQVEQAFASVSLALEVPSDEELDDREPEIPLPSEEGVSDCHIADTLSQEQIQDLNRILQEHSSLFNEVPGKTSSVSHEIHLKDPENLRLQHCYPLPFSLEPQLQQSLKEWLQMGIIAPSKSPFCSPLLAVRKKDGKHRFCLDCRHLNKQTQFDSEPIADITAIFARLSNKKIFSKLDLTSGFWQVPLHEESRKLTAFRTRSGLYEFLVMPFGLANAPATFSRLMREVTADLQNVEVYMDDILVATTTWEEHCTALRMLLNALARHGLRAKPSKCEFGYNKLEYLGHQLSHNKIQPLQDRVEAVASAPLPKNKQQLRSFVGSVGYYQQFVPHFAQKTAPLHDLLKKRSPEQIPWTDVTQDVFESLKKSLISQPILQLPDTDAPFTLRTDASSSGIGSVLLQPNKTDFRHYAPVAYASRRLRAAELNYSTIEKEALGIYWALQKFEVYLYGREFVLQTDHKPLLYLQQADKLNPRLKRWALYIGLYNFKAEHISGADNHLADYLSRLY